MMKTNEILAFKAHRKIIGGGGGRWPDDELPSLFFSGRIHQDTDRGDDMRIQMSGLMNRMERQERISSNMANAIKDLGRSVNDIKVDVGKISTSMSWMKWVVGIGVPTITAVLIFLAATQFNMWQEIMKLSGK